MLHETIMLQTHEQLNYVSVKHKLQKHFENISFRNMFRLCPWVLVNGEPYSTRRVWTGGWRALTGIRKRFCEWESSWHCFRHPISGSLTVHYHWEDGIDLQEKREGIHYLPLSQTAESQISLLISMAGKIGERLYVVRDWIKNGESACLVYRKNLSYVEQLFHTVLWKWIFSRCVEQHTWPQGLARMQPGFGPLPAQLFAELAIAVTLLNSLLYY